MRQNFLLILFILILVVILLFLMFVLYMIQDMAVSNQNRYIFSMTVFVVFVFWLLSLYFLAKFSAENNKEKIAREMDRLQLEESRKLIQVLRSQRHDFKNQLQVIRALSQMKKNNEIEQYVLDCNHDMELSNSLTLQIHNPIISAMILVFSAEAKEKGIAFQVDSNVDFSYCNLSPAKINRILSNIIQNAIEILTRVDQRKRSILLKIAETEDDYLLSVWNNGPVIPAELKEEIFEPGFSTKNSSGLGLSIVKELINELKGEILVTSDLESGTEFKVRLPKGDNA